ncbi:hypothetical protein, partial [Nocardia asiatica]
MIVREWEGLSRRHCPEPTGSGSVQTHVQLSVFACIAALRREVERVLGLGVWAMTAAVEPLVFDPYDYA